MDYTAPDKEERLELENGYLVIVDSPEMVYITEAHANGTDKILSLFAEAKKVLPNLYSGKAFTVLVAPDVRLLQIFLHMDEFVMDYSAFKWQVNETKDDKVKT